MLIATAKKLSIVLNAMGLESGLWDFLVATAKNVPERESALVLSAAGQASFKRHHNQTDPLPGTRRRTAPIVGVADSLDDAKAAFRAAGERLLSPEKADKKCST